MKKESPAPYRIESISQQHQLLGLPKPDHPLVSVINFADVRQFPADVAKTFTTDRAGTLSTNFYSIALKQNCTCKTQYGQQYYDFDQGVLSFVAPDQVFSWRLDDEFPPAGWLLIFHPDFIRHHALSQKIRDYSFFYYAANEALHLSPSEEKMVETILKTIRQECQSPIDNYSQDVLIAQFELLLTYANRFYNRQFITRKHITHDLISRVEVLLATYVNSETIRENGLPTVHYLSDPLNMSAKYLSDVLKKITGLTAQQHIHHALIEKAKGLLRCSTLSVSEIAYYLGFEHPQSFSKLFKQKVNRSPVDFRRFLN